MLEDAVTAATGARNRGIRTQESYTQRTTMPAVTVEMGYITNPAERSPLVRLAVPRQARRGHRVRHSAVRRLAHRESANHDSADHHNEGDNARRVNDQDDGTDDVDSQTKP